MFEERSFISFSFAGRIFAEPCKTFADGLQNLVISGVVSEAQDNAGSDDDVIEVVRDEAPIEILSDGEEIELQKTQRDQNDSVIKNYHFASVPDVNEDNENLQYHNLDDPLQNIVVPFSSIAVDSCECVTPVVVPEPSLETDGTNKTSENKTSEQNDNSTTIMNDVTRSTQEKLILDSATENIQIQINQEGAKAVNDDNTLVTPDLNLESMDYLLIRSRRGATILLHAGYKYRQDYAHGSRISWRCIRRHNGCKASAVTMGPNVVKAGEHKHDEEDN